MCKQMSTDYQETICLQIMYLIYVRRGFGIKNHSMVDMP